MRRRGSTEVASWYRDWATRVAGLDGVHGVVTLGFLGSDDEELDLVYVEGDVAEQCRAVRSAAPHHPDATLIADAAFELITPLQYPWIDDIANSDLPATIG